MQTASKKVINGWAMYDWANSAYNLVITSTIFPSYFQEIAVDNKAISKTTVTFLGRQFENTSLYNYSLAFAMLIVSIISPLLSSIADYKGNKKSFMNFFLTMGSLACASMFFFDKNTLMLGIISIIIACIGFWASIVFYNSFLPEIAAPEDRDRVSARGFAYGYVGSVLLQIICFVFVFKPELIGGNENSNIQYQLSFLLVGIWWWSFGQFSLRRLPKPVAAGDTNVKTRVLSNGYKELRKVWGQLKQIPALKRFLLAFFFYDMGVQTVMLSAALYGASELEIPTTNLIIAILIIQLIAIPGAYVISWLSSKIGNLRALMVVTAMWIGICYAAFLIPKKGIYEFYTLAVIVGFIMGGIQSLSRSTYSKLMPVTKDTASFFSFFDVTEKIATVIGTFSFGFFTELTGSQRSSVLALMIYFILGLLFLFYAAALKKKTI
ncbi:MAG TPA: MFS transporter [Chitinophagaceae bacterium]|jgi:UMF1 family MFS transporter|nr:MFS transporter [Chitinophagaceae bacterium]